MSEFFSIVNDVVVRPLVRAFEISWGLLPEIFFAIIVLFIGWVFAVLLKKAAYKLLKALGLDVVSLKIGLKDFLDRGEIKREPSYLAGWALYWLIIFSALMVAFDALGLTAASQFIRDVIYYIPKIIVALVFLALGIYLGQFVGKIVKKTSLLANIPFNDALGKVAGFVVIGLAVLLSLEYLNVPDIVSIEIFIILFAIVPLAAFMLFLAGGRDIILSVLSGRVLAKELNAGDKIEFDSLSGEIESVDLIATKIRRDRETIMIANSELIKKVIKKKQ